MQGLHVLLRFLDVGFQESLLGDGILTLAADLRDRVLFGRNVALQIFNLLGQPILFVNGWSCSDAYWVAIGPGMVDDGHPAIFMDTRGHGESGLPRDPGFLARNLRTEDVSAWRLGRDVLEVIEDAGFDRVALAGHSMGVQIIVEACRQDPSRVAALFPVAGTFENPVKTFADLPVLDRIYPVADVLLGIFPFVFLKPINDLRMM